MTRIRINYVEREADHKIPRPHIVTLDDASEVILVEHGEIGPITTLLGFCPTGSTPNIDNWQLVSIDDAVADPDSVAGTWPQFVGGDGDMFGYDWQVESIETLA